jgi:hypothetical protein
METHAHGQVHWQARQASLTTAEVLQAGALAAIAAGFIMAAWQMVVAAIAQNPTAVPGIHQTLWTPPEGIWSVVFGVHHLHGSFHLIPVVGGIVGHLGNSLILGIVGVSLLTAILGRRPDPVGAVVHGAAYGVAVEAILINGIVNTQKIQTLYSSTPHWSWWVGHGIFRRDAGPALQRAAGEARGAEHHEAQLTVNHRYDAALRPASGGRPNDKEKQCTF